MPPIERDEKKVAYKRGKRRVAAKQPSPAQCLEWLSRSNLHGVLCRNAVWLACTRQLAYFLERVCLGRRAPPEAAAGVPVVANALGAGASAGADAAARPAGGGGGRGGGGGCRSPRRGPRRGGARGTPRLAPWWCVSRPRRRFTWCTA